MEVEEHVIDITKDSVGKLPEPCKPGHRIVLRNQSGAVLQVCLFPIDGGLVTIPVGESFSFIVSAFALAGKYHFLTHALAEDDREGMLQLSGEIDVVTGFSAQEAYGKAISDDLERRYM